MIVTFPYEHFADLEVPDSLGGCVFDLPDPRPDDSAAGVVRGASRKGY